MKRQSLVTAVLAGIMSVLFIIPSLSGAAEKGRQHEPLLETSKTTMGSAAITEEVVQIIRNGEMARVILNVVGQPGVNYKVEYSTTGEENSYALVPKGAGVIGANGLGTVKFDLRKLGKEEVYLKVTTADSADFARPRVMPNPLVLAVEQVKIKDRGWRENYNNWVQKEKAVIQHKFETRTPAAVCGVRG